MLLALSVQCQFFCPISGGSDGGGGDNDVSVQAMMKVFKSEI